MDSSNNLPLHNLELPLQSESTQFKSNQFYLNSLALYQDKDLEYHLVILKLHKLEVGNQIPKIILQGRIDHIQLLRSSFDYLKSTLTSLLIMIIIINLF